MRLQPGYVTAWNNMADALETLKKYQEVRGAVRCGTGGLWMACTYL